MKTGNLPGPLTPEEFELMMAEFDLACDWMRKQLALRRAQLPPSLPAFGNDEAACSSDNQES
jgi:hypothetical protein